MVAEEDVQMAEPCSSSEDEEEDALQGFVDGLWAKYDVDNNGKLDKEKSKELCKELNGNMGGDDLQDDKFDDAFATVDNQGVDKEGIV